MLRMNLDRLATPALVISLGIAAVGAFVALGGLEGVASHLDLPTCSHFAHMFRPWFNLSRDMWMGVGGTCKEGHISAYVDGVRLLVFWGTDSIPTQVFKVTPGGLIQ